jgi:thimet oligopeptidase
VITPVGLPAGDWAAWLTDRVQSAVDRAGELGATLKDGASRGTFEVLELWNDTDLELGNASSIAAVIAEVHPDAEVRAAAEQLSQHVSAIETDRQLDRALFEVIVACAPAGDEQADRMREHILRDFRRSGVDQDDATRTRLREIAARLVEVTQDFSRVIRDDVRTVRLRPEQLDGLPADYVDAHPADADGLVTLSTDYPDALPMLTFASDAAARLELTNAMFDRGWPDNDDLVREMLDLRAERAALLGSDSWPDYDVGDKMIGSGKAILEFIDRVAAAADASGRRDLALLRKRQVDEHPDAPPMTRADLRYYEQLVRRENYDVDAQQVRRYFEFSKVRDGLLATTGRLFGIEYVPRPDVSVWHEDVDTYDVLRDGAVIGRIFLDLHPREGKFKHAAEFPITSGVSGRQLPAGALVCNLSRGLMEHLELITLFHEFGHVLHHVLAGQQRWARFSGVTTEWDFVEAPSQLLEEWAWTADVLSAFAVDADGVPIPHDLVDRMRAADRFGKGLLIRTQTYYAAVSYLLHRDRPRDLTGAVREIQPQYDLLAYLAGTHLHANFGHLAQYTSGYYTYLWSLVISKDLLSQFDRSDLMRADRARRYRDEILAPGGSRDAADMVESFLGRPYSFDAFERWLNGA